ncbi:MAG: Inositol 2-dehydrogenase [Pelotomaculum sp. PtaB.Bin104]|nr:MAG: Inositol 2-dehydrogenase [Pelotomaculum sp. PtaB.Bin104]
MKQIIQNLKTGVAELANVPCPQIKNGHLLIRTSTSLVSAGTERMLVEFGKANFLNKARQQPEKVRQVLDKLKTDGLLPAFDAVRAKLDQPIPLGYANAGVVLAVGKSVEGFSVGDRVVSNGPHAEVVCVPKNLCVRIPYGVSDETAAFTVIGSVALQAIRLVQPALGEVFTVLGLGLIGLITAQLLKAHGCKVLGVDLDQNKLNIARQFGVETVDLSKSEDPVSAGMAFSHGRGVDGVIITAATKSSAPVQQAARMCRKKGRIVLVGVTGLELSRADFYEKELSFQVSCSYGPGRYDPAYEIEGHDYPLGYVRWTEQRNFEAILDMLASGRLNVEPLISHRFPLERALEAYELLVGKQPYLGILLQYPKTEERSEGDLQSRTVGLDTEDVLKGKNQISGASEPVAAIIGAGNFTTQVILPALKKTKARLRIVSSSGGASSFYAGRKFGFERATTDTGSIFADSDVNTVFVTTRHNTHARFVIDGLKAGKHVFVEKPLCLTSKELNEIVDVYRENAGTILMVGFNRRFAPHVQKMKVLLDVMREPKVIIITVNAGAIPSDHWTQDPAIGGGRIIGEACHFIDLIRYLIGQPIKNVKATRMGKNSAVTILEDKITITLSFDDGSFGTVHYLANGHKSFPKERVEVFCGGSILALDNFRVLKGYDWPGFKKMKLWRQDKGHTAEVKAFIDAVDKGDPAPVPFAEIEEVTRVTLEIAEMIK